MLFFYFSTSSLLSFELEYWHQCDAIVQTFGYTVRYGLRKSDGVGRWGLGSLLPAMHAWILFYAVGPSHKLQW